jgi:hypothetical protein
MAVEAEFAPSVDHQRHTVARVVDEQLVADDDSLPSANFDKAPTDLKSCEVFAPDLAEVDGSRLRRVAVFPADARRTQEIRGLPMPSRHFLQSIWPERRALRPSSPLRLLRPRSPLVATVAYHGPAHKTSLCAR